MLFSLLGAAVAAELAGFEDVLVAVVAVVLVMVALTAVGAAIDVLGVVAAAVVVIAVVVVICFAAVFELARGWGESSNDSERAVVAGDDGDVGDHLGHAGHGDVSEEGARAFM